MEEVIVQAVQIEVERGGRKRKRNIKRRKSIVEGLLLHQVLLRLPLLIMVVVVAASL